MIAIPPSPHLRLKELCDKHHILWRWDSIAQIVTLKFEDREAKVLVGSNMALAGEKKIILSSPVKIVKSSVVVSPDFKRKILDHLLRKKVFKTGDYLVSKVSTIVIDAGHGGRDPGAIGTTGLKEKTVSLSIAKNLKNILKQYGIKVIMTRNKDEFISLKERTEIASLQSVDLFLSIHANSSKSKRASGVEVFALKELGFFQRNEQQRKENEKTLFTRTAMKQRDRNLNFIVSDMLYDHKDREDDLLANYVANKISKYIKARNRGYKKASFYVLKNTLMPAILVEVGFLSNPREEKRLRTKTYRNKISRALAQAILDYSRYSKEKLMTENQRTK